MEQVLRQLIEEVCQSQPLKPQRRKALNRLLIELQRLPGLKRSQHPEYLDALNQTWEWVNNSICSQFNWDKPDVQQRLVQWLNSYLFWRIKDRLAPNQKAAMSLDAPIGEGHTDFLSGLSETGLVTPTRHGLDGYIDRLEQEQQQNIALLLEKYIETDPEGKLQTCYPKGHPECNCQTLAQRVLLQNPPEKFATIAREYDINYQTLKSHWERNCRPLLQAIALELGYQREV